MAFAKQTSAAVDEVRPYLHGVAKHLVDRIWGSRGPAWGTKLTEMEDLLVAIQEVLTERMLAQALQRQAIDPATERPSEFQQCPGCNGATEPDDPEPRLVHTRGGEAEWQEPRDFCRRCRRAGFFSLSPRASGLIGPPTARRCRPRSSTRVPAPRRTSKRRLR